MGQAVTVLRLGGRIPLDEKGIVHRKQRFQKFLELGRLDVFLVAVELSGESERLGSEQIFLGRPVGIEKTDVLLVFGGE
jgi:hypothetical protein